jgi:hypothetical protein
MNNVDLSKETKAKNFKQEFFKAASFLGLLFFFLSIVSSAYKNFFDESPAAEAHAKAIIHSTEKTEAPEQAIKNLAVTQANSEAKKDYLKEAVEVLKEENEAPISDLKDVDTSPARANGVFITSDFDIKDGQLYLCASKTKWCKSPRENGKVHPFEYPSLLVPISDKYFQWYYGKSKVKYVDFDIVNKEKWDIYGDRMLQQTKFVIVKLAFYGDD